MSTEELKERFINFYLVNGFNISKACRSAGVDRTTYYKWIKADAEFKEKVENGEREQLDTLVEECEDRHRLARMGIPVLKDGKIVKWITPPDVRAQEWFLERMAPQKYAKVSKVDHTTNGKEMNSQPLIFVSADKFTDEQLQKYINGEAGDNNEGT